jgi:hypothetical protein
MAYGDLKCRNLIWNSGSGDNTVVLSTLATQSYVTTNFAPKSNPTFAGTINGADLVLSGNLTVSGTQTIINTSVLDVEDINITLGKVSSPSDTTANNGGITLKGSTDKTFNWLNATDSWTSSEHIEIASGKNLKVDGTTFFVDGTNNRVGIGSASPTYPLDLTGNSAGGFVVARINNTASNGYARILLDREGGSTGSADISYAPGVFFAIGPSANDTNTPIVLRNNNATERMRIDSSGNVGIGITSPTSTTKLHIATAQSGVASGTGMTLSGWNGSAESRVQFMSYGIGDGTLAIRIGTSNTERLRVGSAGQIGISGANYGSSGQVLTSGGGSAAPSWTTISAAPEVELVAEGAITANESVIVKSNGKVSGITGFTAGISSAIEMAPATTGSPDSTIQIAEDTGTGRIVVIYSNSAVSPTTTYYRVGTRSGTSITWGTAAALTDTATDASQSAIVCCGTDKFFALYKDEFAGDDWYYTRVISTTSSNGASLGTKIVLTDSSNNNLDTVKLPKLHYSSSTGAVIAVYGTYTGANQGLQSRMYTISGTTITKGSVVRLKDEVPETLGTVYVDSIKTVACVFRWNNNQFNSVCVKQPASGTTVVSGNVINVTTMTAGGHTIGYDSAKGVFLGLARNASNDEWVYYAGVHETTNNGQISWGGSKNIYVSDSGWSNSGRMDTAVDEATLTYQADVAKWCFIYTEASTNDGWTIEFTSSSGTGTNMELSYQSGNRVEFEPDQYRYKKSLPQLGRSSAILIPYYNSSSGKALLRIKQYAATDLTAGNFIGFASAGYSDGNTATIKVTGNTTTQSSLTAGQKYYVTGSGALSTTAGTPSVEAGIALSSTKLLIKG